MISKLARSNIRSSPEVTLLASIDSEWDDTVVAGLARGFVCLRDSTVVLALDLIVLLEPIFATQGLRFVARFLARLRADTASLMVWPALSRAVSLDTSNHMPDSSSCRRNLPFILCTAVIIDDTN